MDNLKQRHQRPVALLLGLIFSLTGSLATAGTITLYYPDAQGNPVVATDINGTILWREHYEPYGRKVNKPCQSPCDDAGDYEDIGYTGHEYDAETGLTYMQARYQDPMGGRFYSIDPVGFDPNQPMTFNRYSYANNNPYKFVDPDGRTVSLAGSKANQQKLIIQMEQFTGLGITQNANGILQSSQCLVSQSSVSLVATSALMSAINSESTINLTAVNADPSVFGDQYTTGKVDVADISGFASKSPQMGAAILTHVLTEYQTAKGLPEGQVISNFSTAHQAALGIESQVFGAANRTNSVTGQALAPNSAISFDYHDEDGNVIQSFNYTLDENGTPGL